MTPDVRAARPPRPMKRAERRVTFWLKTLALVAVAIYLLVGMLDFLGRVRATGILVVASIILAYLVYPLVRRLNRRLPLIWSILIVYVFIFIVGFALVQLVVPPIISDVQSLVKALPSLVVRAQTVLSDPNNRFIRWLPAQERLLIASLPAQAGTWLQSNAVTTATSTLTVLLSTVSVVTTVLIVPVLAAYMMLDLAEIKASFLGLIPAKRRRKAELVISDLDGAVGGFIRGQILDGAIVGATITIMLLIMHVPYAFLIGVVAGIFNFIPYAGAVIGFVPSVLLAIAFNGPTNALIVGVMFAVIQQFDGNFIAPRIFKDSVGLAPFWVIVSILTFSELFGLVGTFLAVPAAAMIRVLRFHFLPHAVSAAEAQPELTPEPRERVRGRRPDGA